MGWVTKERKPITLGYWATDLAGTEVATVTKRHPRVTTTGQESKKRGLSGSVGPSLAGARGPCWRCLRQIWEEREQEAERGGFQTLHKHLSQSAGARESWELQESLPKPHPSLWAPSELADSLCYAQYFWGTAFALGSQKGWTLSLLLGCAWLWKWWGGWGWWEHQTQKCCRCTWHGPKHITYSYSFNPHDHPGR